MSASLSDDEVLSLLFEGCDLRAPGGPAETRRLAREMGIARGWRVIEIGSGSGRAACQIARELGARVLGVEGSPRLVAGARARAEREGLAAAVEFVEMDPRAIPGDLPAGGFDAVVAGEGAVPTLGIEAAARAARALLRARAEAVFGFTDFCWLVPDSRVPPAVRDFWGERAGPAEAKMHRLADAGFSRGFAYPLPESAWDAYHEPIRRNLRRLRERGIASPVLDRYERELHVRDALGGREAVGAVAFVVYPD